MLLAWPTNDVLCHSITRVYFPKKENDYYETGRKIVVTMAMHISSSLSFARPSDKFHNLPALVNLHASTALLGVHQPRGERRGNFFPAYRSRKLKASFFDSDTTICSSL